MDSLRFRAARLISEGEHGADARPLVRAAGMAPVAGYSVRIPDRPEVVVCSHCGGLAMAAGPTGFFASLAICDACLLEGAPQLGMLLVLAAVTRMFGQLESPRSEQAMAAMLELASFARIYERFAARHAPARGLGGFLRDVSRGGC